MTFDINQFSGQATEAIEAKARYEVEVSDRLVVAEVYNELAQMDAKDLRDKLGQARRKIDELILELGKIRSEKDVDESKGRETMRWSNQLPRTLSFK